MDLRAVKLSTTSVVLKPGESKKIEVTIERSPDFKQNVTLAATYFHLNNVSGNCLPPGVTMLDGKSKTLVGTGTAGSIVLKAAADAADCTDVPICVQAYVPINFVVKIGYASEPILVSVKK